MRVGVIGGGIAGLTTAWLLDDVHDVELYEAQPRLGGNVVAATVDVDGRELTLDLGAQHVTPELFPHHERLLELLGIDRRRLPARQSFSLGVAGDETPLLVTPHERGCSWPRETLLDGAGGAAFGAFAAAAAELDARAGDWELTLADLVDPLPVDPELRDTLIYGMAAAFLGCPLEDAPGLSARAATAPLVRAPVATAPDEAPLWHNVDGGLTRLVDALAGELTRTTVRTDTPVHRLRTAGEGFELVDDRDGHRYVDCVVLALPPYAAADLLAPLAGTAGLRADLRAFAYNDVTVGLHREPRFMPRQRRHWSTYNVEVHDGWSDVSIWFGPTHGVDLFKSWIAHRDTAGDPVLARAEYRHLALTPAAVRARRRIAERQGYDGISFAGHHLVDVETQESAVVSAIDVARRLAPDGARLARLTSLAFPGCRAGSPNPTRAAAGDAHRPVGRATRTPPSVSSVSARSARPRPGTHRRPRRGPTR